MSLQYLHPHIETVINDSSHITEDTVSAGTALYQPFISERGEDNTVRLYSSLGEFIKENGEPNFRKHGQSIYNIINWLKTGGLVYGTRLMPDNACYANTVLMIKTKEETVEDLETRESKKVLKVATEMVGVENLTKSESTASILQDNGLFPEVDDDGYKLYPLFLFTVKGRGEYGNKYSIRLKYNSSLSGTYEFKLYDLTIIEKDARGIIREIEGPFSVSTNPDAVSISGTSMFIKNILDTYSDKINCVFNEDKYDDLLDVLVEYLPEGTLPDTIDFLFCRDANLSKYELIQLDENTNADIERYEGASLTQGSDGDFQFRSRGRDAAIEKELNSVFLGTSKKVDITNKKAYPFDVILDANYPNSVKQNMNSLATNVRKDIVCYLDMGLQASSVKSALETRKNELTLSSYYTAMFGQSFMIEDSYTNSDIPVTFTYFLAQLIPDMDERYGIQYPIAGPTRGVVTGFKRNSLSFNPNEVEQEELYINRINYAVQDYDGTEINSNLTTQTRTSALSNINNVRVLNKIIRQIESKAKYYKFEFNDAATIASFGSDLKFIESEWTANRACTSLTIAPYQTAYDMEQKICRVKVDVVFNGTIERIVVEVNVGK